MDHTTTFQEFLTTQSAQIPIGTFVINLLVAACLASVLGWFYSRYGNSLSNRRQFSRNFLMVTLTTMLIISVVKSSLALSLGLVGALSIIRFRAAIKEPEELSYLFLAIGLGLGFGADQAEITFVAFLFIMGATLLVKTLSRGVSADQNLYLTISTETEKKVGLREITEILGRHCSQVDMRRFDETGDQLEASFLVEFIGFGSLEEAKEELRDLEETLRITFLHSSRGVI